MTDQKFDRWIDDLREDTIQGDFGYEPGEFTVYPEAWRALFDEGLTPDQAFRRALAAADEERKRRDDQQRENYARIVEADAALIAASR